MGRWSHLDSDEERLPPGMTRIGYDADTQIYTYRDSDGSHWEGAPGCKYGKLHRVQYTAPPLPSVHIPDNVAGDEQPYTLHDYDSDEETSIDDFIDEKKQFNEKEIALPTSPGKAKLPSPTNPEPSPNRPKKQPEPHHPALPKTLPRVPTDGYNEDDEDNDTLSDKLSGTTISVRESIVSVPSTYNGDGREYDTQTQNSSSNQTSLKRAGTLSRLARFLSSSTSSSPSQGERTVSRRATVAAGRGHAQPQEAQSQGRGLSGQTAAAGVGVPRRRATTFDEILGGMDGAKPRR